jgi:hypothetical protein
VQNTLRLKNQGFEIKRSSGIILQKASPKEDFSLPEFLSFLN